MEEEDPGAHREAHGEAHGEEDDQHSEFQLVPFNQITTEYRHRKFDEDSAYFANRNDVDAARALTALRRENPPEETFAGGYEQYDPNQDPEMYENNCYLCFTKTHKEYGRFYGILAQYLGNTKFETIIDAMYQVFDLFINPHTLRPVEMTRANIKEHVLHHMNEPLVEYFVQLEQYKTARDLLFDSFVQSNGQGDYLFDYKAMSTIDKINTRIVALYKEKPREALFANSALNIGGGGVEQ